MRKVCVATVLLLALLAGDAPADGLAVTVYNSNLGVISETRTLEFASGLGRLAFRDVPSQIDPASVRFEVAGQRSNVSILEQNYAFDLVKPAQLYAKYVDEQIELIDKEGKLFSGILLAYDGGSVTLRDPSGRVKIVSMGNISEVNFPALPEGLITRPTLFWLYRSDLSGERECKVGYQTTGLNWTAEYVGVLNDDETQLGLTGWSSINNTSGKTYKDAKLKLVAGDIHRVTPKGVARGMGMEMMAAAMPEVGGFEEKAFFEYHLYTLPRPATLANREIKQIALFDPAETSVEKILAYSPEKHPTQVEVAVKFKNSEATGLGMPLPAGRVRVFKADDDGSLILLGEDQIQHTPRDEELRLTIGKAFDLVGEQTLVRQDRISKQVEDREFKIELRNHKDEDVTIVVEKRLYGYWEITGSNYEYTRKDAGTVVFSIPVTADQSATLNLTVRYTYPNR